MSPMPATKGRRLGLALAALAVLAAVALPAAASIPRPDQPGQRPLHEAWVNHLPGREVTLPSGELVRQGPRVVEGTLELGVRPSASGRIEVIVPRFFRPVAASPVVRADATFDSS